MRILGGIRQELGGDKPGMKCMTWVHGAIARIIDGEVHPRFRAERADHLANFLQKIPEVYPLAIVGERQGLVEFRRDLDACADVVEQHANLPRRKGLAALGYSVALEANNPAEAGQVVRYPMVRLSQPSYPVFDQNLPFALPVCAQT